MKFISACIFLIGASISLVLNEVHYVHKFKAVGLGPYVVSTQEALTHNYFFYDCENTFIQGDAFQNELNLKLITIASQFFLFEVL